MPIQIHESWKELLDSEFQKPYFKSLTDFVKDEYKKYKVYPQAKYIFRAFDMVPVQKVRVVILGQDPYHGPGQAHGLCFSVEKSVKIPPSLLNIFKEIRAEYGGSMPQSGDLSYLAEQGVLLLNSTLTVREGQAGSHQKRGWETFTDAVIERLSLQRDKLVYLLWGAYAIRKSELIQSKEHLLLTSAHPSPLSASRGFLGNGHFKLANKYLESIQEKPIRWL
ncbi:MAG: uracil-DNA glycosylase [Leptospiraceae bacterium]|nr:uracil-DNA glycosylase [Leptospiraceae bacterium]